MTRSLRRVRHVAQWRHSKAQREPRLGALQLAHPRRSLGPSVPEEDNHPQIKQAVRRPPQEPGARECQAGATEVQARTLGGFIAFAWNVLCAVWLATGLLVSAIVFGALIWAG